MILGTDEAQKPYRLYLRVQEERTLLASVPFAVRHTMLINEHRRDPVLARDVRRAPAITSLL
jgi:hypothetical protein